MMENKSIEIKRFYEIFENIDCGILIRDTENKIVYLNSNLLKIYKISSEIKDFLYSDTDKVLNQIKRFVKDEDLYEKNIQKILSNKIISKGDTIELKNGRILKQTYIPINDNNEYIGDGIIYEDISQENYLQSKLIEMSIYDNLTKIYNRKKIKEEVIKYMDLAKRYNNKLALIIFDVDNFKKINDLYGQEISDNILIKISDLVSKRKRSVDIFGRWGGGEFILILPETDIDGIKIFADYLKTKIYEIILDEREGRITASFGVAVFNENEIADQFINRAYTALEESKNNGKNKVTVYELIKA
ncbi:MAG: GGDEF domain-containing protein [Clostridiales bacterium]